MVGFFQFVVLTELNSPLLWGHALATPNIPYTLDSVSYLGWKPSSLTMDDALWHIVKRPLLHFGFLLLDF